MPLTAEAASAPVQLRECSGCGLLHALPPLPPGRTAHCSRCPTPLLHTKKHPVEYSLALTLAALVLLAVMCTATLMSVQTSGISHSADLFSGPAELVRRNMTALAVVVVFVTVVAPLGKMIGTLYVLIQMNSREPPGHLRRVFAFAEQLRPWSMIEVFVFGVFVAYTKLGDLVTITLDAGVYALLGLAIVLTWADTTIDREAIWERLRNKSTNETSPQLSGTFAAEEVGCELCGFVTPVTEQGQRCPRCESSLHRRKPGSIQRTWALVFAAAVLYVPANYFPVLTVEQLEAGAPSTILGGVQELIESGFYPLAALVFFASIAVPMLKLIGLTIMLVATQTGRSAWLRDRTRLYHIVRWIGRWSMIDIFMESLLGALVQFGNVVTIEPGIGAVAFCAVVILTIFAAETFDPRLMWDASRQGSHAGLPEVRPATFAVLGRKAPVPSSR
jgi:paraquat-inducible protein A